MHANITYSSSCNGSVSDIIFRTELQTQKDNYESIVSYSIV